MSSDTCEFVAVKDTLLQFIHNIEEPTNARRAVVLVLGSSRYWARHNYGYKTVELFDAIANRIDEILSDPLCDFRSESAEMLGEMSETACGLARTWASFKDIRMDNQGFDRIQPEFILATIRILQTK